MSNFCKLVFKKKQKKLQPHVTMFSCRIVKKVLSNHRNHVFDGSLLPTAVKNFPGMLDEHMKESQQIWETLRLPRWVTSQSWSAVRLPSLPLSFLSSYLSSFSPSSVLWLVFCPLNTGDCSSLCHFTTSTASANPLRTKESTFTTAVQQLNIEAHPSDGAF